MADRRELLANAERIRLRLPKAQWPLLDALLCEREALIDVAEAARACIGDAEGQEAFVQRKMLTLTKGQVQLLGAALARLDTGDQQ